MSEGLVLSDRFRLISQLGAGGMGSVWLAEDMNLASQVAIKLIDPGLVESDQAISRFRQEAQAAAMIRSTHVVQILDYGIDHGRPYIAMELLAGENLGQRLERVGHLDAEQTAAILLQVARAVSLAHARGIVHRDLKPENVFLVQEGDSEIAKVLDFGIAHRKGGLTDSAVSKTRTGTLLGTPYYMSPEQATGQMVDHFADIWSFGVIAFECLTGKRAFDGESIGALFHAICMQPLPVPSTFASVPTGFDEWFAKTASRDKAARFTSIREAAETLRHVCGLASSAELTLVRGAGRATLGSAETLSTTAVSAVTSGLDQTAPPSANTLVSRVRKRPVLFTTLSVAALGAAVATLFALSRDYRVDTRQPTAMTSGNTGQATLPLPPAPQNADAAIAPAASVSSTPPKSEEPTITTSNGSMPAAAASSASTLDSNGKKAANANQVAKPDLKQQTSRANPSRPSDVGRSSRKSFIKRDDNAAGI